MTNLLSPLPSILAKTAIAAAIMLSNEKSHVHVHSLSQSIVSVGLNAALQKRFILPPKVTLEPGNVHRSQSVETGVGGKGQDVGVALSCLLKHDGKTATSEKVLLAQFLGRGPEGDAVSDTLANTFQLSDALTVRNKAPLRTCTTIVASDCATELVETSGEVTREEMEELNAKIDELANENGKACGVCIMGSMPPGCGEETYADLTTRLAGVDTLVLIDSVVGLTPLLSALKTVFNEKDERSVGGAVLKLNAAELCKLAGVAKSPGGEADRVTMEELTASAKGFVEKFADAAGALDYLCITDGKYPGYLVEIPKDAIVVSESSFRTWQMPAVDLTTQAKEGMLYPIGAGDTVAAGTLAAWQYLQHSKHGEEFFGVIPPTVGETLSGLKAEWCKDTSCEEEEKGYKMATAFAFGLACGSASCLKQENSVFDVDDAVTFFSGMTRPILQ
ncbi:hypothetical protein ACHAXS_008846 [Conticribra weissflogii]